MDKNYMNYVNSTGLIVPDTSQVQEDIEQEIKEIFGEDIDLSAETVQGRLVEMLTLERRNILELLALITNQFNPNFATGQYLDAICSLFKTIRKPAISTRVLATILGQAGTVLQNGTQAQTTEGNIFELEKTTTIPATGTIDAYFLSKEKSNIPCQAHSLTKIIDQVAGWEAIDNANNGVLGSESQSDNDLRIERVKNLYHGNSAVEDIYSAIMEVEDAKSAFVYENVEDEPVEYQDYTLLPHSVLIICYGGDDENIAKAIYKSKSIGSNYTEIPGQEIEVILPIVIGSFTENYTIKFNRPLEIAIFLKITAKKSQYSGDDLENAIKDIILDYAEGKIDRMEGFKLGSVCSPFEISGAVASVLPEIIITDCQISQDGINFSHSSLSFSVGQIPVIVEENIEVNIIENL
ncbi:MAG: baseplate J/gp47 family protein [Elusimicrobiota bacterium]|jgi:hypothetical protein|nr:baseplate J/gp47 family protein [Elusimicrobiota bacterium]